VDRYLVVGGDGLIGAALAKYLRDHGAVTSCTTRRPADSTGDIFLDLSSSDFFPGHLQEWIRLHEEGRTVAFITAAITGFNQCASDPAGSRLVNVEHTCALASALFANDVSVVFLSTNAVFSGEYGTPTEESPYDPQTEYGRQKTSAERRLLDIHEKVSGRARLAIVRLTKVLSAEEPMIRAWLTALESGKNIEAATDLQISPVSLDFVVRALAQIADTSENGVFHLSGVCGVSYYEFALSLAQALNVPNERVIGVEIRNRIGSAPAPRFSELGMNTTKRIGLEAQALVAVIQDVVAEHARVRY